MGMLTIVTLIVAAGVLALLAVVMGTVLGWANRRFHVEVDPRVEALLDATPGANCGGCGYVGCAEYAEAVARGEAAVTLCAPGGASTARNLASIMGIEVDQTFPYKAVLHCSAYEDQRLQRKDYFGEHTCAAANLMGGVQGCTYGCLGLDDCMVACDYGAIEMEKGLPVIDPETCVGCKACAKACPRNIITMVPFKAERMLVIACANEDSARDVRAVCTVGCSGCGICAKLAPDLFSMEGGLPKFDYDAYDPQDAAQREALEKAIEKCPKKRLIYVGEPTERDLAETADEDLPESIEADFKTSVDDTEWRG